MSELYDYVDDVVKITNEIKRLKREREMICCELIEFYDIIKSVRHKELLSRLLFETLYDAFQKGIKNDSFDEYFFNIIRQYGFNYNV